MSIFASSRKEKTLILQKIIQNLDILEEEKDLYYFSMEILDGESFNSFFEKIISEVSHKTLKIYNINSDF